VQFFDKQLQWVLPPSEFKQFRDALNKSGMAGRIATEA